MVFCLSKTHPKKHVEVASIFRPLKSYRKITSKERRLFAHQNYLKKARFDAEFCQYWRVNVILTFIRRVESVGITKEQNLFSVNPKSMLFQR